MGERTFTREDLLGLPASVPRWWGSDGEIHFATKTDLAAFALTLLGRAERAERELAEAEEAVLKYNECMDHVGSVIYDWRHARSELRDHPAVRRALDRKGEG